jgi:anti-anti-sigma factor
MWYPCSVLEEAEMSVTVEFKGKVARVILSGGIDYAKQEEFKNANKQAVTAEGVNEIQVDFAKTDFIDSSGIRALLILKKETERVGKKLFLTRCGPHLREVFEIGGFDKIFSFQ